MKVILLERIARLGQIGDEVNVKNGFARNYLLPKGKALRATAEAHVEFESRKVEIEAHNLELTNEATQVAEKLDGKDFIAVRQAGETGQLYGSVTTRDVATLLTEGGFKVERTQVALKAPIKVIGLHEVEIRLHADVSASVTINVARTEEEAERQSAGENLTETDRDRGGFVETKESFDDEVDESVEGEDTEGSADDQPMEDAGETEAEKVDPAAE